MILRAALVVLPLLLTLTPSLATAGCGDGAIDDGEHCDDGNSTAGDGCTDQCTLEAGYSCTGIPSVCTQVCGDGIKAPLEACEEGGPGYLFAGEATAAATVEVYLDGGPTPVCTAVASAAGQWTCAAPGLADGLYSAVATVALLGSTAASAPVSFTLDTLAPMAPSLTAPTQGGAVNAAPALSGLAEPGSEITVYEDSTVLCTATALASGDWSCRPSRPLASGAHTMLATATDVMGNVSVSSAWRSFTVDAEAPTAPSLAAPHAGQALAVNTPSLSGTAEPGSTVSVYVDGETAAACTAVAKESGSWSCALSAVLPEGAHSFTATTMDAVGNTSPGASLTPFTVDTQAPDTFITSGPPALVISGEVAFEFSSNEAGVSYECSLDTESFTPCPASYSLAPGPHTLSVRAVDAAGNVDPSPAEYPWTVRLPHLAGGGCSAAPLPAVWLALLGLALPRRRAL